MLCGSCHRMMYCEGVVEYDEELLFSEVDSLCS